MLTNSRVVWSEGMFLSAQHFQQHTRYIDQLLESRCGAVIPWLWGFSRLEIDEDLLTQGHFAVRSARGIMPDGTPFSIPGDEVAPVRFEVGESVRDAMVYLCLPNRSSGLLEYSDEAGKAAELARFGTQTLEVQDIVDASADAQAVAIAKLRLSCTTDATLRDTHTYLGLARIRERQPRGAVELDRTYIPPTLDVLSNPGLGMPNLKDYLNELIGAIRLRVEMLAGRVTEPGRSSTAGTEQILTLQVLNRHLPLFEHFMNSASLHPEYFFRTALMLAGELSTYGRKERMLPMVPTYRHEDPAVPFAQLMGLLRDVLDSGQSDRALRLEIREHRMGKRSVHLPTVELLQKGRFIMGVKADATDDDIRTKFPRQVRIGPGQDIDDLILRQLRGIRVSPLPSTPEEIPYNPGYVYFELDPTSELWKRVKVKAFAFHVSGELKDMDVQMWAIER